MKPLSAAEIKGNWGTVLLPVNPDESIDWARLEDELDYILAANVDGVYTNGTAGEFLSQTAEEFVRISQTVAEKCEKQKVPFQIGASHTSPQTTLERAHIAAQLRPSAIQVVLPDWVTVTDEEAVTFLEKIAEIIDPVTIVLYNPPHAKRVLAPADFNKLRNRVSLLGGMKVMDGDENWYASVREHCGDLSIFVPGHRLASGFRQGASGSYSNVACLHPRQAQKWWELMQTDLPAAIEVERELQEFFRLHITPLKTQRGFSAAAIDKLLAATGAWTKTGTRLRFPYRWLPESETDRFRNLAREFLPKFFEL